MTKKFKILLFFSCFAFILVFSRGEVKAFGDVVKSSSNLSSISKLIEKQKQDVLTNAMCNKLKTATTSAIVNGGRNTESKVIKNPDVNFDSIIDIKDLANTAENYNIKNTSSKYNFKFDLNDDGIIDIYDLVIQSKHLGSLINSPILDMEAYVGDSFSIPSNLEVSMSDGYLTNIKCSWTNNLVNTTSPACFNISGKLTDYNKNITGQVKVTNRIQNFNSVNFGIITMYNNKIFYSNPANNFCLSRCDSDGNHVVKICDDEAYYINVISDWIYYVNASDNDAIYKIKIDGTGRTKLVGDKAEFMNISNGWIYYSNGSDYYTIYKVQINGNSRTKLNDLSSLYVYLYGDQIYFCDYSTYTDQKIYGYLCSINKDGTGFKDIVDAKVGPSVRIGDRIYFLDSFKNLLCGNVNEKLDVYGINGENREYSSINTDGKYLYVSTGKSIFRYTPGDNNFPDQWINSGADLMNICGTNLFLCNNEDYPCMMQLSLQGTDPKIFGVDNVVKKLYAITDKSYQYDNYVYPKSIIAERLDGTMFPISVSWDSKNVDISSLGSYSMTGTVQGFNNKAFLSVNVVDRGNLNQNMHYYNNCFAQKGEWTYFANPFDSKLYKVKNDDSGRVKLSDDVVSNINVIGDYIYYINVNDRYIYRIKNDGTSRTKIYSDNSVYEMLTDGNKIYLQNYLGICSIDMDGLNFKNIIQSYDMANMSLIGNYIIYSDNGIYAVSLDGSYKKCLEQFNVKSNILTDGRYIFRISDHIIYRFDLDTGEEEELSNISANDLCTVFNNKLYYQNSDGIYICNTDGTNSKKVIEGIQSEIFVAKNGLCIYQYDTKRMYSCGYDYENLNGFGEEKQLKFPVCQSVYLTQGSTYTLPKSVMGTMADGSIREIPVSWDNNKVDTSVLGTYRYIGSLTGFTEKVNLDLIISTSQVYGNSLENKSNGCLVAKYNDWIIYSNKSDGSALYKMKSDGTSKTKLNSSPSSDIKVYGDWIYYTSTDGIWRIKADGTYNTYLIYGYMENIITFKDGWMYYQVDKNLYKARIDGCERILLVNNANRDNAGTQAITDEEAIYYESTQYNKFYKINLDGTNNVLVSSIQGFHYNFSESYIYFSCYYNGDGYSGWAVSRMKNDGSGIEKIIDSTADALLVTDNYIYTIQSGGGLYRANVDGTSNTKIASIYTNKLNIIDNWIYFNNDNANYRIKLDGTAQETY